LESERFYLSLTGPSAGSIPKAGRWVVPLDMELYANHAEIQGRRFLLVYTSPHDARLGEHRAEIEGREALRMALKTEAAAGVLFQNAQDSWIALDRAKIAHVLGRAR
jgi:hypothetical protein